ncbi:MAG: hypothetical protein ACTHMO_05470 [Rhodanobacteraceae bacterium]
MDQQSLFHESLAEALHDCIRALGGAKTVGHAMRPEKSIEDARKWLLDCLNPDRAEKLAPDQVLWILRESRKVNCHAAIAYINRECGYADPQPIEPEDERAALQREFVETGKTLRNLLARMEARGLKVA